MEKVDSLKSIEQLTNIDTSNKTKEAKKQEFFAKFQDIKSEEVRKHLEGLYDKIEKQSDRISEKLHLSEVVRYKELVREFMDVAVKNSHHFSKQNFLDKRGRHRVYCIVKNVDRELDELTKEFLDQEVDRISVIQKLDDIKGMLLDVFM